MGIKSSFRWKGRGSERDSCSDTGIDLGEFVFGAGQADLESFDLAEPPFSLGFDDAVLQILSDLFQTGSLRGVWSEKRTAHASVLMQARCSEGATARADRHLPLLKVGGELVPFLVGRGAVFLAGSGHSAAADEGAVRLDRFAGVYRLIAYGCLNCFVPAHELRDMRWQAAHDGIGDEDPAEVMRREDERLTVDTG